MSHHIQFDIRSVKSGDWSDRRPGSRHACRRPATACWSPATRAWCMTSKRREVMRLMQVVGTLSFARDRDTELNVGVLKVQNSDACSESGFACDFCGVNAAGEPQAAARRPTAGLGSRHARGADSRRSSRPRIRLHYLEGMDKDDAPAIVCCSARMELHGAPLSRTWVKLGADAEAGDDERHAGRGGHRLASRRRSHRHRLEASVRGGTYPRQRRRLRHRRARRSPRSTARRSRSTSR